MQDCNIPCVVRAWIVLLWTKRVFYGTFLRLNILMNYMQILQNLRPWLANKYVRIALAVLVAALLISLFQSDSDNDADSNNSDIKTIVSVTTPAQYAGQQSLSLLGNVRAFSEAEITTEKSGQVTSVPVKLGQKVLSGQVIATIENASERAAVLQAEGVYDAAVASAAQNGLSVEQAETALIKEKSAAVSVLKSAYNTTNGVIVNNIDSFFSAPNTSLPGLRIDGRGNTAQLNSERIAFQSILSDWNIRVQSINTNSNLESELSFADQNVQRTIVFIDTFISVFNQQKDSSRYSESELQSFSATFTNLRSTLIGVQSSIDSAESSLKTSYENLERAKLSASGSVSSASDAQVKQALGSLRAAQANLAKTILRSPVGGTVNSLNVRTGDFINSFSPVAVVANNNALEVVTHLSDSEKSFLSEGDKVVVEGQYEGYVTQIAPAVNSLTRKTEVRIAVESSEIVNGDTVRVTKDLEASTEKDSKIQVPLTAVKFERENGSIFAVVDGKLVAKTVVTGKVLGGSVEITEGISATDEFVTDARGLVAGEEVEIK